ncbi:hypothetical protein BG53_01085 [Paenibacillus darwinianus]|uniref:Sporulation protein n=1 Tax=Paenibacillus darwinianus TaxID=1380763 RepID=A0A9W5S0Q3_9BACL|nr:YhcN/YlaJ family sporulation lipoprotein [Paenibacillus darwinianus]EXX88883.1 hypothetical protein BG53_01085 [Paenibacillus darwinianus]EXX89111.1 hypothetical protein BG52_00465 [Paenibacillus darwinianus]EXX90442.1 hypothetical protein CH50_15370 [Paenibacillus darwinianus]
MNKLVRLTAVAVCATCLLAGCNYKRYVQDSGYDYGSRQNGDPKMLGPKLYGSLTGNPRQHDNKYVEYSSMLTNEVSNLNGVASGLVMLTDKNAYVALMLDGTAVGTKSSGSRSYDQNNGGLNEGVYNVDTGSPYGSGSKPASPYNSYYTINDHSELSDELKQTIAAKIRHLAPRVEEVHISANMDFVNEINEYAKQAWAGRSLAVLLEPFNLLVRHQFAGGKTMPVPVQERTSRAEQSR